MTAFRCDELFSSIRDSQSDTILWSAILLGILKATVSYDQPFSI